MSVSGNVGKLARVQARTSRRQRLEFPVLGYAVRNHIDAAMKNERGWNGVCRSAPATSWIVRRDEQVVEHQQVTSENKQQPCLSLLVCNERITE